MTPAINVIQGVHTKAGDTYFDQLVTNEDPIGYTDWE